MKKQVIVRFMVGLALVLALGGGYSIATDALGLTSGPAVQAESPSGGGGGCC